MNKSYFALLTDFGNDFAVASIKGGILSNIPECTIVDVDHSIDKFNLISAAFVISKSYSFFPPGTLFLCVVDPGVGSNRNAVCLHFDGYYFFGPNNGIFHYLIKQGGKLDAFSIDTEQFDVCSNTFHGRDLFSPAAIRFAKGNHSFLVPLSREYLVTISELEDNSVITFIDSFGNIKTNIALTNDDVNKYSLVVVSINGIKATIPFVSTFSDVAQGQVLGYRGSNNTLELAINLGSARCYFQAKAGDRIVFSLKY